MSSTVEIASSFIEGAPPGELSDVVNDIKALTTEEPNLIQSLVPAFEKYNEEQLTTVKLPGGSGQVIVSAHNKLEDGRYYDVESQSSFAFDHVTQKASAVQSYTLESEHSDFIKSLLKALSTYTSEHYPTSSHTVCPSPTSDSLTILLVSSRYSPSNYWNGRYRSIYTLHSGSGLTGSIRVNVHYYEDGNVSLTTSKKVSIPNLSLSSGASEIVREIARAERGYQEELNRGFVGLSDGAFKGLRRQLPVTRQKVEWEKVGGYRLGQDIRGGR